MHRDFQFEDPPAIALRTIQALDALRICHLRVGDSGRGDVLSPFEAAN